MLRQPGKDLRHVLWGLSLTEDHFRHAYAQPAMVIDLREAKIFKGKMAEPFDRFVRGEFAPADLREQSADGIGIQSGSRLALRTAPASSGNQLARRGTPEHAAH